MLDVFTARLEACDPRKSHYRSYRIAAGTDLFGTWMIEVQFGRTGVTGRRLLYSVETEAEASRFVSQLVKRRATAERRIGTGYVFSERHDPKRWLA